jgi:hypothetical protein
LKRLLLTTAALALLTGLPAQAADHTTMFASNYWRVTHIAHNSMGVSMCNMQSQMTFAHGITGFVMIKWQKGQPNPFIQLGKTNWRFSNDLQVPFSIKLDNGHREFVGVSTIPATAPNSIVLLANVAKDEGDGWLDNFAASKTMIINFRNGNEPQWPVKMTGSRDASKAFRSCLKSLENGASPEASTSPVPDVPNESSAPTSPVQMVPIKKPKGDSI